MAADLLDLLVGLQSGLHKVLGGEISAFAASGDWSALIAVLPLGALFGALHALTPGHNKAVLATFVAGNRFKAMEAVSVSGLTALIHIGSAVILAMTASALISRTITGAGQAPLLEMTSRLLLIGLGLWLIVRA